MTSTNDYELKKLIVMQQARRPLNRVNKSKSNLHYARGITTKRATSGEAHLRCSATGQHSSEETSQRRQAVGDTVRHLPAVAALTGVESNPRTPAPIASA